MSRKRVLHDINPNKRQKCGTFVDLLKRGTGDKFDFSGDSYATCEPGVLRAYLEKKFEEEETKKDFLAGLEIHVENEKEFRKCLNPLTRIDEENVGLSYNSQSLIRILLEIRSIQNQVVEVLMSKLISLNESAETNPLHKLILRNLKFMMFYDGKYVADQMLELLDLFETDKQKDLIGVLPEIVTDEAQEKVTDALIELLQSKAELTVDILDCLSNMIVTESNLEAVQQNVLSMLSSVDIDHLPVLLKYLIRTSNKETLKTIFNGIRDNVDPDCLDAKKSDIITDSLKTSILQKLSLCSSFVKFLTELKEHRSIDIWIYFILCSIESCKTSALRSFSNKLKQGKIKFSLLEKSIVSHRDAMNNIFETILKIADYLVHHAETEDIGKELYVLMLKVFDDKYNQQQIVCNQIMHIGSQKTNEVDIGLNVLMEFVEFDIESLRSFLILIKQLLDYVNNLNHNQLRKFYDLFVKLSVSIDVCTGEVDIDPNFEILIQKQFFHQVPSIAQMGVIGKIKIINQISRVIQEHGKIENVVEFLQNAMRELLCKIRESNNALKAFCYEELYDCIVFDNLSDEALPVMAEIIKPEFETYFVGEKIPENHPVIALEHVDIESEFWWEVDSKKYEYDFAIRIAPITCNPEMHDLAQILCPMWKLVTVLTRKTQGEDDIDGIPFSPIAMFDQTALEPDKMFSMDSATRKILMDSLFLAINFFRVCIEMYSFPIGHPKEKEYRPVLVARLTHLKLLEDHLENMLTYVPNYLPSWLNSSRNPFEQMKKKKSPKKDSDGNVKKKTRKPKLKKEEKRVDRLRPHFRTFEPRVFLKFFSFNFGTEADEHVPVEVFVELYREWKSILDESCQNASFWNKSSTPSNLAAHYTPEQLVELMAPGFVHVGQHILKIIKFFIDEDEDIKNFVMANYDDLKEILIIIFSTLEKILLCKALKGSSTIKLVFGNLAGGDVDKNDEEDIFETLFHNYSTIMNDSIQDNVVAVKISNLISLFPKFVRSREHVLRNEFYSSCKKILQKEYTEQAVWKNSDISGIVKNILKNSSNSLTEAQDLVKEMKGLEESNYKSTLKKETLPHFLKPVLDTLIQKLSSHIKTSALDTMEEFVIVSKIVDIFDECGNIVNNYSEISIIQSNYVKEGKKFLDMFIRMMSKIESLFDDEIVSLLDKVQNITLSLQKCANENKYSRAFVKILPELRKSIQKLFYETKLMFAKVGHGDALKFGKLKNNPQDEENSQEEDAEQTDEEDN